MDLICMMCEHREPGVPGCKAFPEGIPDEVLETNEHSKLLPDQGNDLVFEPKIC